MLVLNSFLEPKTLLQMMTELGLLTSLALCLDAGDVNSYGGSSQTWTDISGDSQNFVRGTTSGAQASDPTFNGIAGGKSLNEYFSLDGGDFFTEASALTFAENWHKNNAAFTFGFVMYADSNDNNPSVSSPIFQNQYDGVNRPGIRIQAYFTDLLTVYVENGGAQVMHQTVDNSFPPPSRDWVCKMIAVDEAAGTILTKKSYLNHNLVTGMAYASPSAAASGVPYMLMGMSDGVTFYGWASGVRLAMVFAWNRVMTLDEMTRLFIAINQRFPTLPYSSP